MLEQISRAKAGVSAVVIAVSAAAAVTLDHVLAVPLHGWSSYVAVGFVSLTAVAFERLSHQVIDGLKSLRKALCGEDYIEGTWIEIYQSREAGALSLCIVHITCDEYINIEATTYRGHGEFYEYGRWNSEASRYAKGSLRYFYEERVGDRSFTGSGRLDFERIEGYPIKYQSNFHDPFHFGSVGIGRKVEEKSDLTAIRTGGATLQKVLARYAQEIHLPPLGTGKARGHAEEEGPSGDRQT